MEDQVSVFEDMLAKQWKLWYSSKGKGAARNKVEENERTNLDGGFCVLYNSQFVSNKREPQFEIEEQNEIRVYKNFDESKFNFNSCEQSEILFYVNLDEEKVLSKEQNEAQEDLNLLEEENNCDKSVSSFINHPIVANISPIAKKHSIIPIYPEENLPQVIGQDILSLVLSIFKLSSSTHLRLGFNSLGAFATVNHLHFQLFYADEFFPYTQEFPIENATRKLVLDSSLQNPQEEINMYSVGVRIEQLVDYYVKGLVFSPINAEEQEASDIFSSLAFAVGTYTNILLDEQIPHNIFISEQGQRIFVIPRQFDQDVKQIHGLCKPGILEIAGVFVCRDKEFFKGISTNQLKSLMEKNVSLQQKQFDETVTKFTQLLVKNYS